MARNRSIQRSDAWTTVGAAATGAGAVFAASPGPASACPATAAVPAAAGGASIADQLTQLKGLMDAGVLSPEEFEAAKQKALAGG